jgi:large subunit ribosomal protein L4
MEVAVLNIEGKETGRKVTLSDELFAAEPNHHAIYLDVKQYLANQRQGTHKAKERAEVARTTKKYFRQKGTGGARRGSLKSPVQRGGGTVFGPRPRNYGFKLNKKLKAVARRSAMSIKANEKSIMVVEDLKFDTPKTKEYIRFVEALGVSDKKSLLVLGESNKSVYLSSRNFKGSNVVTASEINTYSILNAQSLVLTEGSLEKLETVLR